MDVKKEYNRYMSYNGELYNMFSSKKARCRTILCRIKFWCVNKTFLEGDAKNFVYTSWGKELGVGGKRLSFTSYFLPFFTVELLIYIYITFIVKINLILKNYYSITSGNKNFNMNIPICVKEWGFRVLSKNTLYFISQVIQYLIFSRTATF